eukprot:MONOS_8501.1-p1 / transcript=MONOS_8501.1 / gene=MONOS_8501 / organism=Monocercomonoides_exilis_PA203 / gene_product=P-type ATPase (P-ATPase) Superfamily Protein / transcript_product=P-type ATPase (P-ATPase) Superfamily Protein / location=Mono_scaffold00322:14126-18110(-) / protein_length=1204 / sequence_SO=supercontig / SO=protein_coding / is_pseudo=false
MEKTPKLARSPEHAKHVELSPSLKGLTSQQVAELVKEHGYNEISKEKPKNIIIIILEALKEPMFLMLLACLILYFVLGDWGEGIMLSVFVFFVIGLEVYQEKKTENAVHALRQLSSPRALVIRDGSTKRVPGRDVVPGEYVILYEGDRVPADGIVLKESNFKVDESLLTGESLPVRKEEVEGGLAELQQMNMAIPGSEEASVCVYSGTLVVGGNAVVVMKTIGMKTELGKIGKSLESVESEKTPLEREMGYLVIVMLAIGITVSVAVLLIYGFTRDEDRVWVNAVLVAISLAMSLLPEEFPVVRSVFFAIGAWRISKKNVLARKNRAIETLGAASVLCSDKTGTLTQNKMELTWLYIPRSVAEAVEEEEQWEKEENEKRMNEAKNEQEADSLTGEVRSLNYSSVKMKRAQRRRIYKIHQRNLPPALSPMSTLAVVPENEKTLEEESSAAHETKGNNETNEAKETPTSGQSTDCLQASASSSSSPQSHLDLSSTTNTVSSSAGLIANEAEPAGIEPQTRASTTNSDASDSEYTNLNEPKQADPVPITIPTARPATDPKESGLEAIEATVEPSPQTTVVQDVMRTPVVHQAIPAPAESMLSPSLSMAIIQGKSYGLHLNLEELEEGKAPPEAYHELIEYAVLASQRAAFDPMDSAINTLAKKSPELVEHLHDEWEMTREYPLSRKMLALSQVWVKVHDDSLAIAAKGAPEAIVDLCHLPKVIGDEINKAVEEMANHGLRVLGVARSEFVLNEGEALPDDQHDFDFEFMGLLGFIDPVREEVEESIKACHGAGIKVVMITGDYPGTAINIAQRVGIPSDEVVLGSELMLLEDVEEEVEKVDKKGKKVIEKKVKQRTPEEEAKRAEIAERVNRSCVFARVVPEQKLALSAHIGIAMGGQRGTDVAREAADLVLLDDSFSSIVHACRLGRRIYTNISKAVIYIISVHIPFAGLALFPIIFGWPVLLHPVHIVFSEILIDPACSVVFEMEPEEEDAFKQPPRDIKKHIMGAFDYFMAFGQGLMILACCLLLFYFNYTFNTDPRMNEPVLIGMVFCCLLVSNMSIIVTNRSKRHSAIRMLKSKNMGVFVIVPIAFFLMIFCLYVPGLRSLFQTEVIPAGYLFEAIGAGLITPVCFELIKLVVNTANDAITKKSKENIEKCNDKKEIEMGVCKQDEKTESREGAASSSNATETRPVSSDSEQHQEIKVAQA